MSSETASLSRYDLDSQVGGRILDTLVVYRDLTNVENFGLDSCEVMSEDGALLPIKNTMWISSPKGGGRAIGFALLVNDIPRRVNRVLCRYTFEIGNMNCVLSSAFRRRTEAEIQNPPAGRKWDPIEDELRLEMTKRRQ